MALVDTSLIFTVKLPIPPSVNSLFRNVPGKGRVKTKSYSDWSARALVAIRDERYSMGLTNTVIMPGAVSLAVEIDRPRADRDLDNCLKPILDALVEGGVINDDKFVASIVACWADGRKEGCFARIVVYPAGKSPFINFKPSEPGSVTGHLEFRR